MAVERRDLFERLARGPAGGVSVVTPNRRLAQALRRDFDGWQSARGLQAWETADVLPFGAFLERLWEDALYSDGVSGLPLLLSPAQEQTVWEEVVRSSSLADALLSAVGTASRCREAWLLAHAWRLLAKLSATVLNEDAQAFLEWSSRYERATHARHQIDSARLPDALPALLPNAGLRKPRTLVLFGFDTVTPQQRAFLDALAGVGTELQVMQAQRVDSRARRVEFTSAKEELLAAARWARARLESGGAQVRIGIVVPDLARSRSRVQRTLAAVMEPSALTVTPTSDAGRPVLPFDLSLGLPLADFPLVHDALLALELACGELAFEAVSRLIRSPFLAAAETELTVRAQLDCELRRRCGMQLSAERLWRSMSREGAPPAPALMGCIVKLTQLGKTSLAGARTATEWAQILADVLAAVGFPGERTLDSAEYQTLKKWHAVLASLATLERVAGRMSCADAVRRVRRLAADTLFQPETPDVPIQVLGALESAGLTFDHLWITGLTDDVWPLSARPNPFIPIPLQRAAGIPYADVAGALERGRRMTQDWLGSAPEVILSHARMEGDSELAPSPLIVAVEPGGYEALGIPEYETARNAIHRAYGLVRIDDGVGPVLSSAEPFAGGTAVFKDQAACPFRAFARHRLDSTPLEVPQPGLDAAERGTLLHDMLAEVWTALGNKRNLDALDGASLAQLLETCAATAVARMQRRRPDALDERFAAAERRRLAKVTQEWLAIERARPEFEVVAIERKRPVHFGGVTVNAKLDRMDRLASGERIVLDYKTGRCMVSAWLGARPDEPQLPMYALGSEEEVSAVAFAQLKTGDLRFKGLASTEGLLSGVTLVTKDRSDLSRQYSGWPDLVRGWRAELEALGRGFAAGDARVDPKQGELTCQRCDQHAFCRVAEKAVGSAIEDAGDG